MAGIIERGSEKHNDHLVNVEKEKLIAANKEKIADLKEKSKTAKPEELKEINDEIAELENPKVVLKKAESKSEEAPKAKVPERKTEKTETDK